MENNIQIDIAIDLKIVIIPLILNILKLQTIKQNVLI